MECPILSLSYPVQERISPSKFIENNIPPARAKPSIAPLQLYTILSMGHAKVRGKCWRAKDVGVLEGGAKCPQFQTAMLQDVR